MKIKNLFLALVASFFVAQGAHAATITWDGGGVDGNWSTPENWVGDVMPAPTDTVQFDGTGTKDADIDTGFPGTVVGVVITNGYSGQINQQKALTVSSGGWTQSGGTFNGGAFALDINGGGGVLNITGGTFNAPSGTTTISGAVTITGATFSNGGGTIALTGTTTIAVTLGSNTTLNQLTVNKTGGASISVSGATLIASQLTLTSGQVTAGTIEVTQCQSTTFASGFTGGAGLIRFTGGSGQVTLPSGQTFPSLDVAASGCQLTGSGNANELITIGGDLTLTNGSFVANAPDVTIQGSVSFTSGTTALTMGAGDLIVQQNFSATGGTLSFTGAGTLDVVGNYSQSGTFAMQLGNVQWVKMEGDFLMDGGTYQAPATYGEYSGSTVEFRQSGYTHNNGSFHLIGSGNTSFINPFEVNFYDFELAKTGGAAINVFDHLTVLNALTLTSGQHGRGFIHVSLCENTTIASGFTGGAGAINLVAGSGSIVLPADQVMPNLIINDVDCSVELSGNAGNVTTFNGNLNITNGSLIMNGASLSVSGALEGYNNAILTGGAGNITIAGNLDVNDSAQFTLPTGNTLISQNFTQGGGVVNATNSANVTIGGGAVLTGGTFNAPSANFNIAGNGINFNGVTFNHNNGTVNFTASEQSTLTTNSLATAFYNLTINQVGVSGITALGSHIRVSNNLTITDGSLNTNDYNIEVGGNWAMGAQGAFNAGLGTVTLIGGNQSISGSTVFNNLIKTVTSASTLTFEAGQVNYVLNDVTLQGASGQLLSLRSDNPGTQFQIDVAGQRNLDYLNIQDSNNVNAFAMQAIGSNFTNSGNNTNWQFTLGATCGNSLVESGETCDDGNTVSGDGCSNMCLVEAGSSGGSGCEAVINKLNAFSSVLRQSGDIFSVDLTWQQNVANTLGNSRLELYKKIGPVGNFSEYTKVTSSGLTINTTFYSSIVAANEFGQFQSYAARFENSCASGNPYFFNSVWVPALLQDGQSSHVEIFVNVKVSDQREQALLNRLTDLLQGRTTLPSISRVLLNSVINQVDTTKLTQPFERDAYLRRRLRAVVDELLLTQDPQGQDPLRVRLYKENINSLIEKAIQNLKANGKYDNAKATIDWNSVEQSARTFLTTEVSLVNQKYDRAKVAETTLINQINQIATQNQINLATLNSLSAIKANTAIKNAIINATDLDQLIPGHKDTYTLQIWQQGNRTTPAYTFTLDTNIFGEGVVEHDTFVAGTYDVTIDRPNAVRQSVNGVKMNYGEIRINFNQQSNQALRFGDLDDDNKIDLNDILSIPTKLQQNPTLVDVNEDGSFDLNDVFDVLRNWGTGQ